MSSLTRMLAKHENNDTNSCADRSWNPLLYSYTSAITSGCTSCRKVAIIPLEVRLLAAAASLAFDVAASLAHAIVINLLSCNILNICEISPCTYSAVFLASVLLFAASTCNKSNESKHFKSCNKNLCSVSKSVNSRLSFFLALFVLTWNNPVLSLYALNTVSGVRRIDNWNCLSTICVVSSSSLWS